MEKTLRLLLCACLILGASHLYAGNLLQFSGESHPDTVITKYPMQKIGLNALTQAKQENRFIQITSFKNIKLAQTQEGKLMFKDKNLTVHEVFPNPANVSTMVKYSSNIGNAKILLKNVLGKDIKEFRLSVTGGSKSELVIPTNYLRNGVYFYTLFIGKKAMASKKLVIKH